MFSVTDMEFDHTDINENRRHLVNSIKRLQENPRDVGSSRKIIKVDSNYRERLLAKYALPFIKAGKSKAMAETYAMNEEGYAREVEAWYDALEQAYQIVEQSDVDKATADANRTLVSSSKNIRDELRG
jgi:hypothetical protein